MSQILRYSKLTLLDFFESFKSFLVLSRRSDKLEEFRKLEKKFVVTTILFPKYQQSYGLLLRSQDSTSEKIFKFGWTLFLVAKGSPSQAPG